MKLKGSQHLLPMFGMHWYRCPRCLSFNVGPEPNDFELVWCVDCDYVTDRYEAYKKAGNHN